MNIDLDVLKKLSPTYAVVPIEYIKGLKELIAGGKTGQSPEHEPILTAGLYEWDDSSKNYTNGDQVVYTFPGSSIVVWVWQGVLARAFKELDSFQKWITGNDKYPNGKAYDFIKIYSEMTGETDDGGGVGVSDEPNRGIGGTEFKFGFTGGRPKEPELKQADPTDALILRLKKKSGFNKTLPSDEIITLGLKAKKEGNQKLLDFLKTIKPLGENFIKKSDLSKLIQEISKKIVKEIDMDEESGTAAASPVTGPAAFKKKKVMDEGMFGGPSLTFDQKIAILRKKGYSETEIQKAIKASKEIQPQPHPKYEDPFVPEPHNSIDTKRSKPIDEMTTTSGGGGSSVGTTGYNIPGAFSRRGGSVKGVKGSEKLGYTLTPAGEQEMKREADKLYEGKEELFKKADDIGRKSVLKQIADLEKSLGTESDPEKKSELKSRIFNLKGHSFLKRSSDKLYEGKKSVKDGTPICKYCHKPLHYAGQIECHKCGKVQK